MDLDEITLLYRVQRTLHQMLSDRGYSVSDEKLEKSKEQFELEYKEAGLDRSKLNSIYEKKPEVNPDGSYPQADSINKIVVFFITKDSKVTKADLENMISQLLEFKCVNVIFIVKNSTMIAKKDLDHFKEVQSEIFE